MTRRLVSPFEFFGRSAATRCFSVRAVQLPRCLWAGQGSFLAAFRKGSAAFLAFSGQQASRRCQVGGRHLPTVSYGQSNIQTHTDTGFYRVNGLRTFGPPSFSHHSVRQTFQYFLQRSSYLCFLCYAKNSLFCFRPFPEVTLLARRR